MATEAAPSTLNGTYHGQPHHHPHAAHFPTDPYNPAHAAAAAAAAAATSSASTAQHYTPAHPTASVHPNAGEPKNDITKDEVGWFFVEQYYTTLSRNPEKLHLFYSRKSQFVSGAEAEKVTIAVGQKAIHERIKELDFQDCKVRVLNVDSQSSFDNILVCVIGEISNKSEPPRRFVQTFVLAEQPNGYYVLNDVIRYLVEDDEELVTDETPAEGSEKEEAPVVGIATTAAPADRKQPTATTHADVEHQADTEAAAHEVDEKLEEAATNGDAKTAEDNTKPQVEEKAGTQQTPANQAPVPIIPATADAVQPEKPKEPEPTPVTPFSPSETPTAATPADKENVPPPKAVPMSWASVASVASGRPATSAPDSTPAAAPAPATPQAPPPKAAPAPQEPAAAPAATTTPTTGNEAENIPSRSSSSTGEWQTADHNKRQSRPQATAGEDNTLAFIKNVNEKIDASLLRQTLQRFGKVKYFHVNRQQACAFVEFNDPAGYKAAVAANPHQIGTERINVEERRPRGNAYGGGAGFSAGRGGTGRGRGDRVGGQGRGGFAKDSGRFATRGRGGGNVAPKGRGQPQPT